MKGAYSEYKHCTGVFVGWILNSSKLLSKDIAKLPNTLRNLIERVELIAATSPDSPLLTKLGGKYLSDLGAALRAGSRAIDLRKQVNLLFVSREGDAERNATHAHCIGVLAYCRQHLIQWYRNNLTFQSSSSAPSTEAETESRSRSIFSYLEDLTFELEELEASSTTSTEDAKVVKDSTAAHDVKLEDADALLDDLRLHIVCFMLDVLAVVQAVETAWNKVKNEKIHILAAVSSSIVGLRMLDMVFAQLQLQYPSIKTAADFIIAARPFVGPDVIGRCKLSALYVQLEQQLRLVDMFAPRLDRHGAERLPWIIWSRVEPGQQQKPFIEQEGKLDDRSEPALQMFFDMELTEIFNHFAAGLTADAEEHSYYSFPSTHSFLSEYFRFFETRTATMGLLVRNVLWLRVVLQLQDPKRLTLGRVIYMMRKYGHRFHAMLSPNEPLLRDYKAKLDELGKVLPRYSEEIFPMDKHYSAYVHNPLLTGAVLLDKLLSNSFGTGLMQTGNYICHLRNALQKEGILSESIPFFDTYVDMFRPHIFAGDELPVRGRYYSSCALSAQHSQNAVALFRSRETRLPRNFQMLRGGRLQNKCLIALRTVMFDNDLSSIIEDSGMSLPEVLGAVEALTISEVCGTRTLSLHCMKCLRFMYGFCVRLASIMGLDSMPRVLSAFEPVTSFALGAITTLGGQLLQDLDSGAMGQQEHQQLHEIAQLFVDYFKSFDQEELFVFPVSEKGAMIEEFGTTPMIVSCDHGEMTATVMDLNDLMIALYSNTTQQSRRLVNDDRLMREATVARIRKAVLQRPLIVKVIYGGEYPTLLDHCLSGGCADLQTAEWLILMGGLLLRGMKKQFVFLRPGEFMSHLQVACRDYEKSPWAVELVLGATQGVDVNLNSIDMNTALHYAAIVGKSDPFFRVMSFGGLYFPVNATGQSAMHLISSEELMLLKSNCGLLHGDAADQFCTQLRQHKEEARERVLEQQQTMHRGAHKKKLTKGLRKEAAENATQVVTADDIARQERAQRELLAMFDAEEEQKAKKGNKNNKGTKKKGGKAKG